MGTCSPLGKVFSISGKLEDPGVAVSVRHEDVPGVRVDGHVGGLAEVAAVTSWSESFSQSQQGSVSAITAHLQNLMTGGVRLWTGEKQMYRGGRALGERT